MSWKPKKCLHAWEHHPRLLLDVARVILEFLAPLILFTRRQACWHAESCSARIYGFASGFLRSLSKRSGAPRWKEARPLNLRFKTSAHIVN